uniref:Transcriptional regulator n=1 Tax=uncultured bacterium scaffold00090 TaxID=1132476 RepID=I7ARI4_9BACT|nr:transcriptional regulator [uncultured bacterium scaffold00090]
MFAELKRGIAMKKEHSRRWQETEIKLERVTLGLMTGSDLEHITVRAICEKAGVNRTTFYEHFQDVYDLFDKMETELRREIMEQYHPDDMKAFTISSFIPIFEHIRKYQYFYRIVLKTRTTFPIREGFERLLNDVIRPACTRAGITDESRIMYHLVFFQAGFTVCLRRWVDGGCQENTETLAEIINASIPNIFMLSP